MKMFRRSLAGLAGLVTLVAGSTVQAAYVYSLDATAGDGLPDFVLTVPALISATTTFALTDFDSLVLPASPADVVDVTLRDPLSGSPEVSFNAPSGSFGFFWAAAFTGPGTYCAGILGCSNTAAVMTIRQTGTVPEPATVTLLALGVAGLAARRRLR